jgi:predicted amidohydrolase
MADKLPHTPDMLRVAAVQMNCQREREANLARCRELVAEAAAVGARVVVLPENFSFFGPEEEKRAIAEPLDAAGPIVSMLKSAARDHDLWLIGGGMPEASGDPQRPHNSCVVVAPDGSIKARYRKIHMFDVEIGDGAEYRESAATMPGSDTVVVEVEGVKLGLSICYDLRFPELYRRLSDAGAQVLLVPSAFTLATGKDHWHVLLRARAIEAQAYVVAAAQWGRHGKRVTYGKSCIIDPWGEVIAQASEGEGIACADIDIAYLDAVRAKVPSLTHRTL